MGKVRELIQRAKDMGQKFIAITDHGSTSGLWEAQKIGEELGVQVLLGTEFYYERENDGENGHLIVIAKSDEGLENIFKLQEYAYVDNFYKKPRINWDKLVKHKDGLIISSACLASTFSQYILETKRTDAINWARKFKNVFGEDFYLEIQPNQIPEQMLINETTIRIANQLGIKVIATNDVHYVLEEDAYPHEVMLAMQVNKKMFDDKRFKFSTNDFWLKSEKEMIDTFVGLKHEDIIDALNNTSEIADKCNAKMRKGKYLPDYYNVPQGHTQRSLLVDKIISGIREKGMSKDKDYIHEVQNEIDVIDRNGYSGYFLIVQDYVNTARRNGIIVGDGRGSGAGSKVAWLTDITKIPPHKYDLLFERFMADGRSPDFDVDFSDQDAVFSDLVSKYGENSVARIIAFGTMTPKSVCRKVLSTFDFDTTLINKITKLIPDLCPSMQNAYKISPELLEYKEKYDAEFRIIEKLEGRVSHESKHAGGVVIYPNLAKYLPIKTTAEDRSKRIVAFDKIMLEELGFYKFDILGLETLPIIRRCLDSIKKVEGKDIDLHNIDLEDSNIYDMLCKGDVSGIFQLNNQAQKVMEQQPKNFKDLIAINALIRPGVGDWKEYIARRKGKEWSTHKDRLSYIEETSGLIAYQEQYLLDAKTFAGWDIAFADKNIRKNKDIRNDVKLKEKFISDSTARGYNNEEMESLWEEIVCIVEQGYGFNKSHSASYAVLSYQTAWLKYYYPEHFYASLMTSEKTDSEGQGKISGYINECKQKGIKMLPPDINNSGEEFVVANGGINYKITAIKNVGESAIESIKALRPVKSFDDFMERREKKHIKKNVLTCLIKAGCFDFDNTDRSYLLWKVDMENRTKTQIKDNYQCEIYEWNDEVKSQWEMESLGVYLSIHPMEKYGFKTLDSYQDNSEAIQGGEIYEIKQIKDKRGNDMAFVFINTLFGNLKVIVFSSDWKNEEIKGLIKEGNKVFIKGNRSGDSLLLNKIELLS